MFTRMLYYYYKLKKKKAFKHCASKQENMSPKMYQGRDRGR